MTEKEALQFAEEQKEIFGTQSMMFDFLEIASKTLEKQIPKIPDYEGDGMYAGQVVIDTWICPCCEKHYEIDYDDYEYCPKCGQHIDHSTLTEDD